jgi:hypothetical protein
VAEGARNDEVFDVECPHCHKRFSAELLSPRSPRQSGFKCPHCRLFVSYDRVVDPPRTG